MVLIDAAKGCATLPPDLLEYPADFVVVSFYKVSPGFSKINEALLLSDFDFLVFRCFHEVIWLSYWAWRSPCTEWCVICSLGLSPVNLHKSDCSLETFSFNSLLRSEHFFS